MVLSISEKFTISLQLFCLGCHSIISSHLLWYSFRDYFTRPNFGSVLLVGLVFASFVSYLLLFF
jgi:hypothetical protein